MTLPLVKAQGRAGFGATFALSYNSQMWSATTGKLANDVGYGYGWKLQAGSVRPVAGGGYIYTDATGAEYNLSQQPDGTWTSSEGVYVVYSTATSPGRLYFPSGVYWAMGCTAGTGEADAGTLYPTLMQDTNGNQIVIHYYDTGGNWLGEGSARISTIEDVRTTTPYSQTYVFSYSGGHLATITGPGPEAYTFGYTAATLVSPLTGTSYGTVTLPTSVTTTASGLATGFSYAASGSAELVQMTTASGGQLRWDYGTLTYAGSVTQREVTHRYLMMAAGGAVYDFPIAHEGTTLATTVAGQTTINDPAGGQKAWWFATTGNEIGLLKAAESRLRAGVSQGGERRDFTWSWSAGGAYIASIVTTADVGTTAQVQKRVTQVVSDWGERDAGADVRLRQPDDAGADVRDDLPGGRQLHVAVYPQPAAVGVGERDGGGDAQLRHRVGRLTVAA